MRTALYLPCALLMGIGFHPPAPTVDAGRISAASILAAAPVIDESGDGQDSNAQAGAAQNPQQPQNSGSQNPANPPSDGQDELAATNAAVEKQVVPLADEPHHQIMLRNDFVHVYSVSVPPLDATLIHRHDLPYMAVSLGASDVENAVVGKPEVRLVLPDGQVMYSPGGFAHAVRTGAGTAFRNVTIELAKPQGSARNMCKQIVAGPEDCPQQATNEKAKEKKPAAETGDEDTAYFETDEIRADVIQVSGGRDYIDEAAKENALLVAMTNSNLDVNLGGEHVSFLHDGDIVWMPAGMHRKVVDFLGTRSNFLLVTFKDSTAKP